MLSVLLGLTVVIPVCLLGITLHASDLGSSCYGLVCATGWQSSYLLVK
jgi:hypothetical protein